MTNMRKMPRICCWGGRRWGDNNSDPKCCYMLPKAVVRVHQWMSSSVYIPAVNSKMAVKSLNLTTPYPKITEFVTLH